MTTLEISKNIDYLNNTIIMLDRMGTNRTLYPTIFENTHSFQTFIDFL